MQLFMHPKVYLPAEDSYLLASAAQPLGKILEIGCGSGYVSIEWAKHNQVEGVDINPIAVEVAKENARRMGANITFYHSDLFSQVKGKFDGILFNPPYLPTDEKTRINDELNLAFDGGKNGRKTLDRFLGEFETYLNPGGKMFLIQSSLNNLNKTLKALNKYDTKIIAEEQFFFEKLYLLEVSI